jgi:two-component system response regulator WspF
LVTHRLILVKNSTLPVLFVIGASAGGPAAVATVLQSIPENTPVSIVVVQHLSENFINQLKLWFQEKSTFKVKIAKEYEMVELNTVYVAGGSGHLIIDSKGIFRYNKDNNKSSYMPSIDIFFESVALNYPAPVVAAILTGMGEDGARGLKEIRQKGHLTIAQDESTSSIYGMPKVAKKIEAASVILPLDMIGVKACRYIKTFQK